MMSIAHSVLISVTCSGMVLKLLVVLGMSDIFRILISFFCVVGDGGALPLVIITLELLRWAVAEQLSGESLPKKEVPMEWDRCRGEEPQEEEVEPPEGRRLAGMTMAVVTLAMVRCARRSGRDWRKARAAPTTGPRGGAAPREYSQRVAGPGRYQALGLTYHTLMSTVLALFSLPCVVTSNAFLRMEIKFYLPL
jgi:hypothetical protein